MAEAMTRVTPVVFNPVAGHSRDASRRGALDGLAAAHGATLVWWPTRAPGHAAELAREAVRLNVDLVLAFGGDGTYNEVAQGLIGSTTALGVLPGGTTSVLAYELSVPRPAADALDALLAGVNRPMRAARTGTGQIILLMLSAGPDAIILDRLLPSLKRLGGRVGVALQAIMELARSRMPSFSLSVGDSTYTCGWSIVGKSRCYAGPFAATPGADPFRGDVEVVAQRSAGRCPALAFAASIPGGRHVERHDVVRWRGESVTMRAPDGVRVPYQIDGDVAGELPVSVTVDPRSLLVRLPRGERAARVRCGDRAISR